MSGVFWGGLLLGVVVMFALAIWSLRRHRDPDLHIESDRPIDELMPTLAGLTLGTAVGGNRAEVHENGAYFDALIGRILAAKKSVHFETFLWKDGALSSRLADALIDRARAGVPVRVLLDAEGSKEAGQAVVHGMRQAGCAAAFFHERALRNLGVFNDRDHRKLVVIDGREALSAATASWTSGWAMPKTASTSPTSACTCKAPSCTACKAPSARTGRAKPASCSSARTSSRSSSPRATS